MEDVHANAMAVGMMVQLSKDFAQRMSEQKKDRGIIDFNDMEHLALDILVKKMLVLLSIPGQQMNLQRALMRY